MWAEAIDYGKSSPKESGNKGVALEIEKRTQELVHSKITQIVPGIFATRIANDNVEIRGSEISKEMDLYTIGHIFANELWHRIRVKHPSFKLPLNFYPKTDEKYAKFPVVFSENDNLESFRIKAKETAEAITKGSGERITLSAVLDPKKNGIPTGDWLIMEVEARNGKANVLDPQREGEKQTAKIIPFPTQTNTSKKQHTPSNALRTGLSKNKKKAWVFRGLMSEYAGLMSALWQWPSALKEWFRN